MRIGVTLPQFGTDVESAIAAARAAADGGLHGVFVFDHLWGIGQPDRPALTPFPLLGALATETEGIALGPLVARVSLFPDAVLVHHFATLHRMIGDRLIAGLGTGDAVSAPENIAFGAGYPRAEDRRASVSGCARRLRAMGITTWIGGRAPATLAVARRDADAVNLWDATPSQLRAVQGVPVTWAGIVPSEPDEIAAQLQEVRAAGATWAVCAAPGGPERVIEATAKLDWHTPRNAARPPGG